MITKLKCPTCQGPAETIDTKIVAGVRVNMYKCGHAEMVSQLDHASFDKFVSEDGKKPFKYQIDGALFAIDANARVLIADECGLGKTNQALMTIWSHPNELTKCLVVCKAGLKYQWSAETQRWCGLSWMPQILTGEQDFILPKVKVCIISFDCLWRFKDIEGFMKKGGFKCVILDEVQHIKNGQSKRTNAVREVCRQVDHVIALSGTPIKNHAAEYFPVLNILRPDIFRTKSQFEQVFVDTYWNGHAFKYGGIKDTAKFERVTKDFIIRRCRADVMPDLPEVMRDFRFSELGPVVEEAYKQTLKEFKQYYNYGGADDSAFVRSSNILSYLSKMRHLAGLAKVEPALDYIDDFCHSTDRKLTIFVHHKDVARCLHDRLSDLCLNDPDAYGMNIITLSSDMSPESRAQAVKDFQATGNRIMIASTLASGEGLNLQFCSDALIVERQWNPANEEQAEGRFVRIGQAASSVNACYLVAVGTVDEFFSELVEKKRAIVANTLDGKEYVWEESNIMKELAEVLAMKGGQKWGF